MADREPAPSPQLGFSVLFHFPPFSLMNRGLILGLVKEEAADVNEVAAGFPCSSPKEPSLSAKEKHTDYRNEVNWRLQGRGVCRAGATRA